ncbi:hypothetical protein FHT82_005368 [Rhizobium sp. BK275]|uniref:sulfite exporter TauE/SafE family protein n=1 Tax=Rhizobium sp. BK275 TaxID=2587077 RepID=UPI00161E21C6|nr:sulfite exporter TauE/SafE family protein [Rhizobium sp. BK275]MBB3392581.1 hypothetical protein [Rhizobium sp. BK275]
MITDFFLFIVVGFCAQIVDGALGMAFGVLSTTSLLALGVPVANASAMTHVTEMFTTAASGISHVWHRNVDWKLVARLAPAGMIGGAVGAFLLASVDGKVIEPFVSAYLIAIGLIILWKAFHPTRKRDVRDWMVPPVGLCGGVLDAVGGGGWGPIVTSSLVGRGHDPKRVIGSTSFTEFAVTLIISITFVLTLGWSELGSAVGLIIGGVIAAPFGAILVKRLPMKLLMIAVSLVIITTSAMRFF